MKHNSGLRLPPQSPPVSRERAACREFDGTPGVEPAQSVCDSLTGLAQQMCYAVEYGVNE
jgi:hypothetical protein